jgi:hypothetical protein
VAMAPFPIYSFRHLCSGTACLRARHSAATVKERLNTQAEIALILSRPGTAFTCARNGRTTI